MSPLLKPCFSVQSVLSAHLSGTTEDPRRPSAETALGVFVYHGRLGAHLHRSVSFAHVLAGTGGSFSKNIECQRTL